MYDVAQYLAGAIVFVMFSWIIQIIAYWKIFVKAGEPGWKSIIPVYSSYVQYRLTWRTSMFWLYLVLMIIAQILIQAADGSYLMSVIGGIFNLAALIVGVMSYYKLAKAFGHGAGFTLGLVFLYPIFILILGFGSSEYLGNTSES